MSNETSTDPESRYRLRRASSQTTLLMCVVSIPSILSAMADLKTASSASPQSAAVMPAIVTLLETVTVSEVVGAGTGTFVGAGNGRGVGAGVAGTVDGEYEGNGDGLDV